MVTASLLDEGDLMKYWPVTAGNWAQWCRTFSQPSVFLLLPGDLQWFCEILCLARQGLRRAQKRDFAPVRDTDNMHWRAALGDHVWISWCARLWCQHLYGLWMKGAALPELGTPARQDRAWQAQQSSCSPVPTPQEKCSESLVTEGVMTCDWNFYLNPENRTGLILNSQETAAAGGAGRHHSALAALLFPPESLSGWPPALAALLREQHRPQAGPGRAVASPGAVRIAAGRAAALLQGCCSAAVLLTAQRSQDWQAQLLQRASSSWPPA